MRKKLVFLIILIVSPIIGFPQENLDVGNNIYSLNNIKIRYNIEKRLLIDSSHGKNRIGKKQIFDLMKPNLEKYSSTYSLDFGCGFESDTVIVYKNSEVIFNKIITTVKNWSFAGSVNFESDSTEDFVLMVEINSKQRFYIKKITEYNFMIIDCSYYMFDFLKSIYDYEVRYTNNKPYYQ